MEPLLSGIYIGDIDQLSLLSTFPQFYKAEQEHGSLIRGLKKMSKTASKTTLTSKNQGVFLTLKNGLQSLVDTIETQLKDVTIQKGVSVKDLKKGKDGHYELNLNDDESLQADGVILALPHPMMAELMLELMLDKNYLKDYKDMPATTVATVVTAFNEDAINLADGVGFVVSRHSDYTITACTWTHKKWPHTAPKGMALLRCYVGRIGEETVVDLSDTEIEEMVLEDLKKTLNITAKPKFSIVTRWMNAFPQYNVGHYQRMNEMNEMHEALCKDMPGVYVTGSSCGGLGLPDCITQGKVAAEKIRAYFE